MVDLKDLRENPDKYRRGAELKGVRVDIDEILVSTNGIGPRSASLSCSGSEQNEASKKIGQIKDAAEKQAAIAHGGIEDEGEGRR